MGLNPSTLVPEFNEISMTLVAIISQVYSTLYLPHYSSFHIQQCLWSYCILNGPAIHNSFLLTHFPWCACKIYDWFGSFWWFLSVNLKKKSQQLNMP